MLLFFLSLFGLRRIRTRKGKHAVRQKPVKFEPKGSNWPQAESNVDPLVF